MSDDRQSLSLHAPFVDLAAFPTADLIPAGTQLWRIVADEHVDGPVWFGCQGTNRFDLHPLDGAGTCYLGLDPTAAIFEAGFREGKVSAGTLTLTPQMFNGQHLRPVTAPHGLLLVDVGASEAAGFGVTRELTTVTPVVVPQWWAQALHRHGPEEAHGILFEPRHALRRQAAAVFGPYGGATDWDAGDPIELDASTLRAYLRGTGVDVLEPPRTADNLTIID